MYDALVAYQLLINCKFLFTKRLTNFLGSNKNYLQEREQRETGKTYRQNKNKNKKSTQPKERIDQRRNYF